ncbi:hypothetical protein FA15DRAFT_647503 [Coprinopsis marcescibilis]|uniref:Uncharacterized protein n=1 Tax=Coprinopsis marcescibilis TaxID=230819 RepID=A0A5C3KVY2_COPMA|nr:hypothetical protein FA15DRAFT_647503 [Coprinopsis marcescibilis]
MASPWDPVGDVVAIAYFLFTIIGVTFVAMQIFIVLYGLSIFLETPKEHRKGRTAYIAVSFIILVLSALAAALDAYHCFRRLYGTGTGVEFLTKFAQRINPWETHLSGFATVAYMAIGDLLLLYRAYVIWSDHRWLCIPLSGILLTSIVFGILTYIPIEVELPTTRAAVCWAAVSVSFNVATTVLIAFRLILSNNRFNAALPSRKSNVLSNTVIVLVEAALPVTVFGLFYVAVTAPPPATTPVAFRPFLGLIFSSLYFSFMALSPQLIIFRVTTGRSWANAPGKNPNIENTTVPYFSRPLQFQVHQTEQLTGASTHASSDRALDETEKV